MTLNPPVRRAFLVLASGLLLLIAWQGFANSLPKFSGQSLSTGQWAQTITQAAYSAFAILSIVTALWARRWTVAMLIAWTVSVAVSAALAPIVWGGTPMFVGVISGVSSLLVGAGLGWLLMAGTRRSDSVGSPAATQA